MKAQENQREEYIGINNTNAIKVYPSFYFEHNKHAGNKCAYCGKDLLDQYVMLCEVHFTALNSWVHCVPFCRECRDNEIDNPSAAFVWKMFEVKRTVDKLAREAKERMREQDA